MHSQTAFLRVRILVGPPRTNISWQTKTKDAGVRRLHPFRQTFFGTSRENIDLKKTVGQLLCMIRVYSLLVQNFCSCSKLTILQWLSQSSYSNTCKNPVIHTSEYVGRTKMHGKNFLKPRKAVLGHLRTWQKNRTKKEAFPPKIYHFEVQLPTPILRRFFFTKEIFGCIQNHKSYAFLHFFTSK